MGLLNTEELKKQIKDGTFTSIDDITNEFKNILREVLQTASEEEMTSHLGYEKHQTSPNPNYRNGHNKKSLKSKYGEVDVAIPRDRDGSFEPQLVKKRERLLDGSEDMLSLIHISEPTRPY